MPPGPRGFHAARLTVAEPKGLPKRMHYGIRELLSLEVPTAHRRQGLATQLMQRTVREADECRMILMLTVKPYDEDGIADVDRLTEFYARFGFFQIQDDPRMLARKPKATVCSLPLRRAIAAELS